MYSIYSQIGGAESGLLGLGQHLASTVLADMRLVCVLSGFLSALFLYLLCLSVSFPLWEPHSLFLCLVIWDSFNPTTLGSDPAVQYEALHLCASTFNVVHSYHSQLLFLAARKFCSQSSNGKISLPYYLFPGEQDSLKHKSSRNVPSSVTFKPDANQKCVA